MATSINRKFYAAKSYMGINMSYDAPCWTPYVFLSKNERDQWLIENKYSDGNLVAETVTAKVAHKMAGCKSYEILTVDAYNRMGKAPNLRQLDNTIGERAL